MKMNPFLAVFLSAIIATGSLVAAPPEDKGKKEKGGDKKEITKLRGLENAISKLNQIADKLEEKGNKEKADKLRQKIAKLESKLAAKLAKA